MEDRDKASLPANLTDAMLLCLEYASQHGVNQQLEPINRSETILLNTIEDEDMLAAIRAAASEAARMKAASMELLRELEGLSAQIRVEAVQAGIRLESAEARLAVAEGQVENAREDYRLALRRYDAQVGTNLDVLDSRAALTDSRRAYVNAVYDIAAAQCGLMFSCGHLSSRESISGS